jgi:hypothetical protein
MKSGMKCVYVCVHNFFNTTISCYNFVVKSHRSGVVIGTRKCRWPGCIFSFSSVREVGEIVMPIDKVPCKELHRHFPAKICKGM